MRARVGWRGDVVPVGCLLSGSQRSRLLLRRPCALLEHLLKIDRGRRREQGGGAHRAEPYGLRAGLVGVRPAAEVRHEDAAQRQQQQRRPLPPSGCESQDQGRGRGRWPGPGTGPGSEERVGVGAGIGAGTRVRRKGRCRGRGRSRASWRGAAACETSSRLPSRKREKRAVKMVFVW